MSLGMPKSDDGLCPRCGAPLRRTSGPAVMTCSYCGCVTRVNWSDLPGRDDVVVEDAATGTSLARLKMPSGWEVAGRKDDASPTYAYPYDVHIDAMDMDGCFIHYRSGEGFCDADPSRYQGDMIKGFRDHSSLVSMKRFQSPSVYIQCAMQERFAKKGIKLTLIGRRALPLHEKLDIQAGRQRVLENQKSELLRCFGGRGGGKIEAVFFDGDVLVFRYMKGSVEQRVAMATLIEGAKWDLSSADFGQMSFGTNVALDMVRGAVGSAINEARANSGMPGSPSHRLSDSLFGVPPYTNPGNPPVDFRGGLPDGGLSGAFRSAGESNGGVVNMQAHIYMNLSSNARAKDGDKNRPAPRESEDSLAKQHLFGDTPPVGPNDLINWRSCQVCILQAPASAFDRQYRTAFTDFFSTLEMDASVEQEYEALRQKLPHSVDAVRRAAQRGI